MLEGAPSVPCRALDPALAGKSGRCIEWGARGARIVHREAPQRRSCAAGQTGRNDVPDHERQEAGCFMQRESTRMRGSCWCSFGLFWSARAVAVACPPRTGRVLRSMNVEGQRGGRSSSGPRRRSTEASGRCARSLRRWCCSADFAPSARLEPRSGGVEGRLASASNLLQGVTRKTSGRNGFSRRSLSCRARRSQRRSVTIAVFVTASDIGAFRRSVPEPSPASAEIRQ